MKPTNRPPSASGFAVTEGPFRIYRNLTRKCWSVQSRTDKGWRVTYHMEALIAKPVTFLVYPSGQKRVRETRHKNVHAYIWTPSILTPDQVEAHQPPLDPWEEITYDPYVHDTFVTLQGEHPISSGAAVLLTTQGRAFGHNIH
jgi:hypothetical protein